MCRNRFFILIIGAVVTCCTQILVGDDPKPTAVATFEQFWKDVDASWPEFETKRVNWDSLHDVYYPQVATVTSDGELIKILSAMVVALRDQHTNVYAGSATVAYRPSFPHNSFGFDFIRKNY